MIITGTGKYVTTAGKIVVVESHDGYRRAHGKDANGRDISWYTETGYVRSGTCNGNDILIKLEE
jgi:hypothetical protein